MPEDAVLDKEKAQKFLQQVMKDVAASFHSAMSYIGDRLGIFKAIAAAGPVTVAELARRTGLQERYLREWLGSMVAAQYIEYDPATGRYHLPPEHVGPLADEDSPVFLASMFAALLPHLTRRAQGRGSVPHRRRGAAKRISAGTVRRDGAHDRADVQALPDSAVAPCPAGGGRKTEQRRGRRWTWDAAAGWPRLRSPRPSPRPGCSASTAMPDR